MKPISELSPLEIREAVATRVMGLSPVSKLYDPVRDMFVDVTAKRCANDRDVFAVKGPLDMWRELPAYESEIGPAFEVVDKCRAIGVYIEVIAMASIYLVNWQAYSARRLQHELEQAQRERDEAIERADSYREAAMELYLWTKEPHDRSPNG